MATKAMSFPALEDPKPASLPPLENKTLSKVAQQMATEYYEGQTATQQKVPTRKAPREAEAAAAEAKDAEAASTGPLPALAGGAAPEGGATSLRHLRALSPNSVMDTDLYDDLDNFSPFEAFDEPGLDRLQTLWEQHEAAMDSTGERFVEHFDKAHSATLQNVARIKDFDLKAVLEEMQKHAQVVRTLVMDNYQYTRDLEGNYASTLYGTAKETYEVGIRTLLERTNAHHRDKMRSIRLANGEQLARERVGAREEQKAALKQQSVALAAALHEGFELQKNAILKEKAEVSAQADELRVELEKNVHETSMLKQEINSMQKDLKMSRAWKIKFEQEKEAADKLRKENAALIAGHEKAMNQMDSNMRLEVTRRDREIERLRATVLNLEAEMKDYRSDANIAHIRVDKPDMDDRKAQMAAGRGRQASSIKDAGRVKSANSSGKAKDFRTGQTGRDSKMKTPPP